MAAKKKTKKKATKKAKAPARKTNRKKTAKKARKGKNKVAELIISKSRTKNAVENCNVSSDFYSALDQFVRDAIAKAEERAMENKRRTLRPQDL